MDLQTTHADDWREALDEADAWHHNCAVISQGERGYLLRHFDDPHNLIVNELGHIEEVEL